ncbi:MAG: hypothetical protein B7C24_14315 [Bacteroidetes bacterium 4572_77]|nr:MAG: hypothetical protein B7C24_14315 [Bacteroidetes bacterium 4572_77]
MQIIPFTTRQTKVRVVNSKIGKVVPIVDIAKAIDYDAKALKQMLERNSEVFEGTVRVVTVPTVQDNRGTKQTHQNTTKYAILERDLEKYKATLSVSHPTKEDSNV